MTTTSAGMLMETGTWSAKERIEYSTLILTHKVYQGRSFQNRKRKECQTHSMKDLKKWQRVSERI